MKRKFKISERDYKILRAMMTNVEAFLVDAERQAADRLGSIEMVVTFDVQTVLEDSTKKPDEPLFV